MFTSKATSIVHTRDIKVQLDVALLRWRNISFENTVFRHSGGRFGGGQRNTRFRARTILGRRQKNTAGFIFGQKLLLFFYFAFGEMEIELPFSSRFLFLPVKPFPIVEQEKFRFCSRINNAFSRFARRSNAIRYLVFGHKKKSEYIAMFWLTLRGVSRGGPAGGLPATRSGSPVALRVTDTGPSIYNDIAGKYTCRSFREKVLKHPYSYILEGKIAAPVQTIPSWFNWSASRYEESPYMI